jgi:hypothetical protein
MSTTHKDELDKLNHIYKKQWVFISDEEVLASAIALEKLLALAHKK